MDHEKKSNNHLFDNRLGMRPSRSLSAKEELERISADSNPNTPVQTDTGDIVLNSGEKKIKDKKVIIIAILAVVIVAVFAVGLVMRGGIGNNNGSGSGGTISAQSSSSFMTFAKAYLGDDINFSEKYSPSTAYKIDTAIDEHDSDALNDMNQKFNDFTSTIDDNTEESFKNLVEQYKKAFYFAYSYGLITIPTEDDILKKYLADGKDATVSYITGAYSAISEIDYNDTNAAVANEILYYISMVSLLDLYNTNGCLSNKGIADDECLTKKADEDAIKENTDAVSNAVQNRKDLTVYINYSKSLLWDLNAKINGEDK